MNYIESVSDFFKSPKWMMNMLLGGVCVLIPVIGPMVVMGWLITGFWGRQDQRFETFPEFDFSHFGKYLERGLWPFLVTFVASIGASIVLVPLIWVLMIPAMLIGGVSSGGDSNLGGCLAVIVMVMMMLIWAIVMVAVMLVLVPLKIRASIAQDFAKSFDFGFVNDSWLSPGRKWCSVLFLSLAPALSCRSSGCSFSVWASISPRADLLLLDASEQAALCALRQPRR